MKINQLDLFSGIGGFHLGFERAGYEVTSYFSEIDKHAIAVYKHKFKDSTYVGSVTDVRGADLPRIDLITFGSPCQDFSLAGKRLGMEGQRSSLVLQAIRLIRECKPSVFVWENVKGTFSSNDGADFWAIIQAFANIGGYRLEWQLLNTSWFLPQNRERIYLVGYSTTTKRNWRGVFPIGEDNRATDELSGHNPRANTITTRYTGNANGSFIGECQQSTQEVKQIDANFPCIIDVSHKNEGVRYYDKHSSTLSARDYKEPRMVVQPNYGSKSLNETIEQNTLTEGEPKALDLYNREARDTSPTLTEPHHNSLRLFDGYRIRRLTPIECERLQGFPDNHTEYGNYDGEVKKMSNTQRYKQCGNAVTVDVVKAVAEQCKPLFK